MEFFFCEKCGKRLTDQDIQAGKARHKQVKGVFCSGCAEGVMTMEFEAISPEMIEQFRKEQKEKQRRGPTTSAAVPVAAPPPPVRRPAPGSRPSIPVPPARRPTSGRMRPERPRFAGEGEDPGTGPSKKPLVAAALAAVAVVMALALVFMRGGTAPAIKDRVEAPDVPLAPQETANAAVPPKELAPAKPSETKASPAKTVAEKPVSYDGPTRTVELFPTDDVEDAKGAGAVHTDRAEIVVSTQPISSGDLRFDLSKLGAAPLSAELMLYPSREPEAGSAILVHRLSGMDWTEANFKEMRSKNRTRGAPVRVAIKDAGPIRVDVTPQIGAMAATETALTLHLQADARKCSVAFASREGPEATRPRLVVKIPDQNGTVAQALSAPPAVADGAVYLADLKPRVETKLEKPFTAEVGGQSYPKSLGSAPLTMYHYAVAEYDLKGEYSLLRFGCDVSEADDKPISFHVLVDEKEVWKDDSPPRDIDLAGAQKVKLTIYCSMGGNGQSKGTWLSPRIYRGKPEAEPPKSKDLAATAVDPGKQGSDAGAEADGAVYLADHKQIGINLMDPAGTVTHDGKEYPKSLPSQEIPKYRTASIVYELNGAYERFKTEYAVTGEKTGRLSFLVLCDGKQVWTSAKGPCDIDVTGVKALKLAMWKDEFDPPSLKGVWLSPRLYKKKAEDEEHEGDAEAADALLGESVKLGDMRDGRMEHMHFSLFRAQNGKRCFKSLLTADLVTNRSSYGVFNLRGQYAVFRSIFQETPAGVKGLEAGVYCDGKKMPAPADGNWEVDVRGVKELKLVVNYPSGTDRSAQGVWLSPRLFEKKSETKMPNDSEEAGAESQKDEGGGEAEAADPSNVAGSRTRLADRKSTSLSHLKVAGCRARDGKLYYKSLHTEGLAQNRECSATFNLDGQFGVFKTGFQEQPEGLKGLEIAVYRDGKQVPAPADNKWNVDVRGVKELKLVVSYPSGADPEAKAVWLDPTVWRVTRSPKE